MRELFCLGLLLCGCEWLVPLDGLAGGPRDGGTGCRGDLTTDRLNCGSCGHSCLGGECVKSRCQPVIIAEDQPGPLGIGVSSHYVFWVNQAPAGLVRATALVQDSAVVTVTFENVPAFVWQQNVALVVPEAGSLTADVAFGGNFFLLVDAAQLDMELIPANAARLADLGMHILAAGNEQITVRHPKLPHIDRIIDMRFYIEPGDGEAVPGRAHSRNMVVLGDHMVDRSPCGTGTCAEMALRHARDELKVGQDFLSESIIGTRFIGRIVAETVIGHGADAVRAVRPQISGSAHIMGLQQFVLEPDDPFPEGFLLA